MQAVIRNTVTAIGDVAAKVEVATGNISGIAGAVTEQEAVTREIARNVEEAAAGTSQVTLNVEGVVGAAEEAGTAAKQVLGESARLSEISETLNGAVHSFLVRIRQA